MVASFRSCFPLLFPKMVEGDCGNISMYVYVHVHVFAPCCVLFFVCCLQKDFCCFICSASLITYGMCELASVCTLALCWTLLFFLLLILFPGVFFVYFSLEDFLYIFPSTFSGLRLYDYKWIWLYICMCVYRLGVDIILLLLFPIAGNTVFFPNSLSLCERVLFFLVGEGVSLWARIFKMVY